MMRSFFLVPWRLSRAFTPRASVQSKRSYIAPWTTHGRYSETCACASGSRKRPHLSSVMASCTFGGYGRHLNETGDRAEFLTSRGSSLEALRVVTAANDK